MNSNYTLIVSRGISKFQRAILEKIAEKESMDIIEVCALVNYLHAKRKNPSISPNDIWLIPSEPHDLEIQENIQSIYRLMKSLEERGLVARLLHRRPAVWLRIDWNIDGKPRLILNSVRSWSHFNSLMKRDGRVRFRTKGGIGAINLRDPTYNQLRHQNRQREWKLQRRTNSDARKRKKK